MKTKIDIPFEFKVMGVNAYVPPAVAFIILIYSIYNLNYKFGWMNTIKLLEMTLPFLSGWYSVFLFQDVLEEMGSETIFTYPVKRYELGILRVLIFYLFYLIILASVLLLIQIIGNRNIFLSLFIQLSAEGLFFSGLGFLCVVITSSSIWALTVLVIYAVTQILTSGSMFKLVNIYQFNGDILSLNQLVYPVIRIILLSLIFFIAGQILFSRYKNYK